MLAQEKETQNGEIANKALVIHETILSDLTYVLHHRHRKENKVEKYLKK